MLAGRWVEDGQQGSGRRLLLPVSKQRCGLDKDDSRSGQSPIRFSGHLTGNMLLVTLAAFPTPRVHRHPPQGAVPWALDVYVSVHVARTPCYAHIP